MIYTDLDIECRVDNIYVIEDEIFNIELYDYIKKELKRIIDNILPYEIIECIIKNMDINYQWIEIRKKYNLINSPINLDFNIDNYQCICKKYLTNLKIAFIFTFWDYSGINESPILYFLYDNNKQYDNNLNKDIDIIYSLNYQSCYIHSLYLKESICINNLNLNNLENLFEEKFSSYRNWYLEFIDEVIEAKIWRNYIDVNINFLWDERKNIKNGKIDIINVFGSNSLLIEDYSLEKYCYKKKNYVNFDNITFKYLVKELLIKIDPNFFVDHWDTAYDNDIGYGIIVDNEIAMTSSCICFVIQIDFTNIIKIVNIDDLSNFKRVTLSHLIKKYGKTILK